MTQRYEWEDALIEAETVGIFPAGAVNTGLRLARQITWYSDKNKTSELRWKNELAAELVSVSRATMFRNIKTLKEEGYLLEKNGNLLPAIPESHNETVVSFLEIQQAAIKSHLETKKSQSETRKSQDETGQSQSDNPYTVDICTVDKYSDDSFTVDNPATPGCRKDSSSKKDSSVFYENTTTPIPPRLQAEPASGDPRQSHLETEEWLTDRELTKRCTITGCKNKLWTENLCHPHMTELAKRMKVTKG